MDCVGGRSAGAADAQGVVGYFETIDSYACRCAQGGISMKRNVWILMITIVTICCVVGGTFYHIFRFGTGFFGRGETKDMSVDLEAFHALNVDANWMDVTVTAGERFYLSCEYTDGLEPLYELRNGTLTIKQRTYRSYRWGVNNMHCNLTLTIPDQAAMDKLDVHTALGNVRLEGISGAECEIQSNMGNCELKKCSFDKSDLVTNMGEISASDTGLGEAEVNNDMGEVNIDDCTFAELDITAAMGSVSVDAAQVLDGYEMDLEADLGSVHVNNRDEGTKYHQSGDVGKLSVSTSMGSVEVSY